MRTYLAEFFVKVGTLFSEQKVVHDAIQHQYAVLRRVPKDSPDRPKILSNTSNAHFQFYHLTGYQHSLDIALLYGTQAKDLALTLNLRTDKPEVYLEIMKDLGYFLSHRFQLKGMPKDIDESIACKREVLEGTAEGSDSHHLVLDNLASTLRARYLSRKSWENKEEARKLLEKLLS